MDLVYVVFKFLLVFVFLLKWNSKFVYEKIDVYSKIFLFLESFLYKFNVDKKLKLVFGFCDGRFNCVD